MTEAVRHACGLDRTFCDECSTELEIGQVGKCNDCIADCACDECGGDTDGGDGYDGLCPDCADEAEKDGKWN